MFNLLEVGTYVDMNLAFTGMIIALVAIALVVVLEVTREKSSNKA